MPPAGGGEPVLGSSKWSDVAVSREPEGVEGRRVSIYLLSIGSSDGQARTCR